MENFHAEWAACLLEGLENNCPAEIRSEPVWRNVPASITGLIIWIACWRNMLEI